jgi:hypothetical protein
MRPGRSRLGRKNLLIKLTLPVSKSISFNLAKRQPFFYHAFMGAWTTSFLFASVFWGAVGSGYFIYGWKQKAMLPLFAGIVMSAVACFVPALPMSLICIALMVGVWWLVRQGY